MAQHDFIAQLAAALAAGNDGAHVIARAIWSGLDIDTVEGLIETAEAVAAG